MRTSVSLRPRLGSPVLNRVRRLGRELGIAARAWCRAAGGATAVEFALAAPMLIMLMLASAELARFVILNQKLDRVAISTSDLVARAETISESKLVDILIAAEQVAQPFDLAASGRVIVSSIVNEDGDGPTIAWQRSDDGTLDASSKVGQDGGAASLPEGFEVREGETAIISEVFFSFEPFLSELIVEPQTVYKRAHHRPRLGTLEDIEEG